jgi:hypothetical protein
MSSAGSGKFLSDEFNRLLGPIPDKIYVHALIVMSIADLENLAYSVERFSCALSCMPIQSSIRNE